MSGRASLSPVLVESNKLLPIDRPAHNWYRFVLSFPPHLVRDYLGQFGINSKHRVLDPFCGTGTTLVECKKTGIPSVGVEANPMAYFASKVKTDWKPEPKSLLKHADTIAKKTLESFYKEGIDDEDFPLLSRHNNKQKKMNRENLRTLSEESDALILERSISPLPLHKSLALIEQIRSDSEDRFLNHELLAFAKAIVFEISNLRFGPEVGLGLIKEDAPVVRSWLEEVKVISDDIARLQGSAVVQSDVCFADSRDLSSVLEPNSIDAVITSPPYPNEKDYSRTTRLESVLLGLIQTKEELRSLKQKLVRSNTRSVYKSDSDDELVSKFSEIQRIAKDIENRRIALNKTSGFERLYARVTKLYFGGMLRHLSELRPALRPGAMLAYVVGDQASYLRVMIRTGQILADIANSLGYEVERIDLFRTRIATATKAQLREEVVLLRWPGKHKAKRAQTVRKN